MEHSVVTSGARTSAGISSNGWNESSSGPAIIQQANRAGTARFSSCMKSQDDQERRDETASTRH
jgi:hypothetical protein